MGELTYLTKFVYKHSLKINLLSNFLSTVQNKTETLFNLMPIKFVITSLSNMIRRFIYNLNKSL